MVYSGVERRSEPRRLLYKSVKFVLASDENNLLNGTVINISDSGLGLYSFAPLKAGDLITIKTSLPTKHLTYSVRWVTELLGDFFMLGLRCKDK